MNDIGLIIVQGAVVLGVVVMMNVSPEVERNGAGRIDGGLMMILSDMTAGGRIIKF